MAPRWIEVADSAERIRSVALRMAVGICAFSWAALIVAFLVRDISPDPLRPAYLIGGGLFGAGATVATRGAGRRSLGKLLTALGYLWTCGLVAILLLPSDRPLEDLSFVAMTLMLVPLWLFLSARAGRSHVHSVGEPPSNKPLQPTSGGRAPGKCGSMGRAARG